MTQDDLKTILNRILTWPRERQEDAEELLTLIEKQDKSPYALTDEQFEEMRRRIADPDAATLTLSELDDRLRHLGI